MNATIDDAFEVLRAVEVPLKRIGALAGLYGSVSREGRGRDLDLVVWAGGSVPLDVGDVRDALASAGLAVSIETRGSSEVYLDALAPGGVDVHVRIVRPLEIPIRVPAHLAHLIRRD